MTISDVSLYLFDLSFTYPISIKGKELSSRKGILLVLKNEKGEVGVGEASPLPGFSKETFDEALTQLISLRAQLASLDVMDGNNVERLSDSIDCALYPSVEFALESAFLSLGSSSVSQATDDNQSLNESLLPLNALLTGDHRQIVRRAEESITNHFQALKIKVGQFEPEEAATIVCEVYNLAKGKASIRLDVNRAWSLQQANLFAEISRKIEIEYIEEPCSTLTDTIDFANQTAISVALDESLFDLQPDDLMAIDPLSTLILKPTLLGMKTCKEFIRFAEELNIKAVISSAFESSVGINMLGHMARANDPELAAGLETVSMFEKDILCSPMTIKNGSLLLLDYKDIYSQLNHDLIGNVDSMRDDN